MGALKLAKVAWVRPYGERPGVIEAFVSSGGSLYKMRYDPDLGIIGLHKYSSVAVLGNNVQKVTVNKAVADVLPTTVSDFLSWAISRLEDLTS